MNYLDPKNWAITLLTSQVKGASVGDIVPYGDEKDWVVLRVDSNATLLGRYSKLEFSKEVH